MDFFATEHLVERKRYYQSPSHESRLTHEVAIAEIAPPVPWIPGALATTSHDLDQTNSDSSARLARPLDVLYCAGRSLSCDFYAYSPTAQSVTNRQG